MKIKKFLVSAPLALMLLASCGGGEKTEQWAMIGFERLESNPILSPDSTAKFYCPMRQDTVAWMESDVFNPAATVIDGQIAVVYRAEDNSATGIGSRTSRLGIARSSDGVNYVYDTVPVLFPSDDAQQELENPGGCEDPRIAMTDDGLYVMMYTQWNRKQARLAVATSRDLVNWTKHGPAFARAYDGRFADDFSKSASIVTEMKGGRPVIAKIKGKYWMYWGEKFVNVATSDNLVDWTPLLDEDGELLHVMDPRPRYFDSSLTECGPPALLTDKGIIMFYNGKNAGDETADARYTPNTYCGGQALFDKYDPTRLITRLDEPFFKPEADFEKSGQYPAGTVFIEGLVWFNGKWYLYYGCADSRVSVAVYNPNKK